MLTTTPKRNLASLDHLRAMRRPGESYSDVILRLALSVDPASAAWSPRQVFSQSRATMPQTFLTSFEPQLAT
jgi:hypothetical protein